MEHYEIIDRFMEKIERNNIFAQYYSVPQIRQILEQASIRQTIITI